MLIEVIGVPALLEQTAEEAVEVAHASLKLARMLRDENKVHGKTREELIDKLQEETVDLSICLYELIDFGLLNETDVSYWMINKLDRMKRRLEELSE